MVLSGGYTSAAKVRSLVTAYEADIFVSAISAYGMALKHRVGLWPQAGSLVDRFENLAQQTRFMTLDVTSSHAIRAGQLSKVHSDPFDRIIAAQTQAEDLRVVSRDKELRALGADVVWG